MKLTFEFNDGETAAQIVSAIIGLFGQTAHAGAASIAAVTTAAQIAPQDNPSSGQEPEEPAGTPTTATHDTTGLAYDARIHSTPAAMTDKGVWRKKRGAPATLIAQVEAELRATKPAPAAAPPAQQLPIPGANAAALPLPGAAAGALPLPGAAALQPPVQTAYTGLVDFLAKQMQSAANPTGRLTETYVTDCLKHWGIVDANGNGSLQALQNAPDDRIQTVRATFAQALGIPA